MTIPILPFVFSESSGNSWQLKYLKRTADFDLYKIGWLPVERLKLFHRITGDFLTDMLLGLCGRTGHIFRCTSRSLKGIPYQLLEHFVKVHRNPERCECGSACIDFNCHLNRTTPESFRRFYRLWDPDGRVTCPRSVDLGISKRHFPLNDQFCVADLWALAEEEAIHNPPV